MVKLNYSKKYPKVFSYDSRSKKLWGFRYNYYDNVGKRHEKQLRGFSTAKAANEALLKSQLQYTQEGSSPIENSEVTIAEWAKKWYATYSPKWRPMTQDNTKSCLRDYIIPLIGSRKMRKITKADYIREFINPLSEKLAPSSVESYHKKVMTIFNKAVENGIINRNALSGVPIEVRSNRNSFTKEDLEKFNYQLDFATMDTKVFFYTLEFTGMRKGEALALTWNDIDINTGLVTINKDRNDYGIGETKTPASNRTISIPEKLIELLKKYRVFQIRKHLRLKKPFEEDDLIFTNYNDRPFCPSGCGERLNTVLKRTDITKHYVVHSFRHTHASMLLEQGVNPVDIAKRLGHSSIKTTLDTYSHTLHDNDRKLAEDLAKNIEII